MNLDGCPGCEGSAKQKQRELQTKYKEGKRVAEEMGKIFILYEDDQGRYQFMEGEAFRATGYRAIKYISFVPDPNDG